MGDFKVGDTVEVSFEATVIHVHSDGFLALRSALSEVNEYVNPQHATKVEPEWDIKVGDRFRFTVEATYRATDFPGLNVGTYGPERDFEVETSDDDVITVERISGE